MHDESPTRQTRKPLRDAVYDSILQALVSGEFQPGERLRDTHLAQRLGASRTPVREALLLLTSQGLLTSDPGRGFAVAPMTRTEVEEVFPLIRVLELHALRESKPCSAEQHGELDRLAALMDAHLDDAKAAIELDTAWHELLISGCSNRRLHGTLDELRNLSRRYHVAYFQTLDEPGTSRREHEQIAEAFARDDRDEATRRLEAHWLRGRDILLGRLPLS